MKEETNNGRSRRSFDETFKRHAVALSLKGDRPIAQIAQELGISDSLLHAWRRQFAPEAVCSAAAASTLSAEQKDEEIARLRAEIVRMREREIVLKKSLGILSETPESGMPKWKR